MYSWGLRVALSNALQRRIREEFGSMSRAEEGFMTRVSISDFLNYLKVDRGFIYDYSPEERLNFYLETLAERRPATLASMLDEWFALWAAKWRQRVKLTMKGVKREEEVVRRINERTRPLMELPVAAQAKLFALGSLVRSGEVCFTDLLSESAVKGALYYMVSRASGPEVVAKVIGRNPTLLLSEVIKRVKAMARFKGPLVTLKLEQALFSEEGARFLGFRA